MDVEVNQCCSRESELSKDFYPQHMMVKQFEYGIVFYPQRMMVSLNTECVKSFSLNI